MPDSSAPRLPFLLAPPPRAPEFPLCHLPESSWAWCPRSLSSAWAGEGGRPRPTPLALRSCPFHAPPASVLPHPCPFLPFAPLLALGPLASVSASSLAPGRAGERAYGRRGLSQSQGVTWPSSGPWLSTPAVPYRPCDPWLSGFAAPSIHCTPSRPLGLGPGGEARGLRHGRYFVQR